MAIGRLDCLWVEGRRVTAPGERSGGESCRGLSEVNSIVGGIEHDERETWCAEGHGADVGGLVALDRLDIQIALQQSVGLKVVAECLCRVHEQTAISRVKEHVPVQPK